MVHKSIGVGLVSYNRPKQFDFLLRKYTELFGDSIMFCARVDGGPHMFEYNVIKNDFPNLDLDVDQSNIGVGRSKNTMLHKMYEAGCDYFFLAEDDIEPLNTNATQAYIDAYKRTGIEHFNFAHHGSINESLGVMDTDEERGIQYYPGCVGAWSFYTRNVLDTVGYMDEVFYNAWEHVELTWRIAKAGLTSVFWRFVDVKDSFNYLREMDYESVPRAIASQPGSTTKNIDMGRAHWQKKDPECPI